MNNRLIMKKCMTIMLTVILLLSIVIPAMAQQNKTSLDANISNASLQRQGPTNAAEMETFMDALLKKEMEENHVAGAAVSVVKDGKLFFAKGYGYADVENKIPVDPDQTVFRIGSVTKLFTWTAVMQLVEQGKLSLDEPISRYSPDFKDDSVKIKHLVTHTASGTPGERFQYDE